jgi:hypothetical protein
MLRRTHDTGRVPSVMTQGKGFEKGKEKRGERKEQAESESGKGWQSGRMIGQAV